MNAKQFGWGIGWSWNSEPGRVRRDWRGRYWASQEVADLFGPVLVWQRIA